MTEQKCVKKIEYDLSLTNINENEWNRYCFHRPINKKKSNIIESRLKLRFLYPADTIKQSTSPPLIAVILAGTPCK